MRASGIGLWWGVPLAAGLAGAASAQQAPPPPELAVRGAVGYGGSFSTVDGEPSPRPGLARAGRFFPVWVEVENRRKEEPLIGTVQVRLQPASGGADRPVATSAPVRIGPGAKARVRCYLRAWAMPGAKGRGSADRGPVRVEVVESNGRIPTGGAADRLPMPHTALAGLVVAVVGDRKLEGLARALGGLAERRRAERVLAEDLPEEFAGYDGLDALVWPQCEGEAASLATAAALEAFVRRGGVLVFGAGTQAPGGALDRLVPADFGPVVQVDRFTSLPSDPGLPPREAAELLHRLTPRPGAHVVAAEPGPDGTIPWWVERPLGAGRVVVIGADLTAAPFRTAAEGFWRRVASGGRPWPPGPDVLASGVSPDTDDPDMADESASPLVTLARSLADVEQKQTVPFGWLAAFLGAYVLLIGPVDYFLLRRLNRLEWTFFTFAAVTVAVTACAWIVSQRLKGGEMLLRGFEIRTSRAGEAGGAGEALLAVFSNVHSRLEVRHAAPDAVVGTFWVPPAERETLGSGGSEVVVDARAVAVRGVAVKIWTSEWFHAAWSAARPSVVSGRLSATATGGVRGTITLTADRQWRDVWLVRGDRAWLLAERWNAREALAVDTGKGQPRVAAFSGRLPTPDRGRLPMPEVLDVLRAASAGIRLPPVHPWLASLAVRPAADEVLLLATTEGDPGDYTIVDHAPASTLLRIERVIVPVEGP